MKYPQASSVFLTQSAIWALAMTTAWTVAPIYYVNTVGMDPLQLVLVGTVLEATCFLFEVPTGIIADLYSRRLSITLGVFLMGGRFLLEGAVPSFAAILLAQVIAGIGCTLLSGASQAWLADEIGDEQVGPTFMRGSQAGRIGTLAGIAMSVGLGSISVRVAILAGGLMMIGLGIYLVLCMREHGFKPAPREDRTTWQSMTGTFAGGLKVVRAAPLLATLVIAELFVGMASEGFDRLGEPHFLKSFGFPNLGSLQLTPVVWFGIIGVVGLLLALASTEIVRRRIDMNNHRTLARYLTGLSVLRLASVLAFALAGNFPLALAAFWATALFGDIAAPLFDTWLTQSIEPRVRATVLSMNGQANALGQIGGGPVIGMIGNLFTIRAALLASGLLLTPVVLLYRRTLSIVDRSAGAKQPGDTSPEAAET